MNSAVISQFSLQEEPGHIVELLRKTLPSTSRSMMLIHRGIPLYRKEPIPRGLVSSNDLQNHN
jgi:hypothetical protein